MKLKKYILPTLGALLVAGVAYGAANSVIRESVALCDPNSPSHCAAPDSSGNVPVTISSTTGTSDVNLKQVNGVTTSVGAGATGTGTQRVGVAQDTTTIAGAAPGTAGTASANVVTVQGVASMTPVLATPAAGTTNGASAYFVQPAASDNHAVIKNGAGTAYFITAFNNSATINYVRLYDAGTGFNGCNSATNLITQAQIPASTSVGGFTVSFGPGIQFATGISICVTSGYATTDTTNATATAMSITVGYK